MIARQPAFTNEMLGCPVVDAAGRQIGALRALFTDTETHEIVFGAVSMLRRGRRHMVFVPLDSAHLDNGSIAVRCGSQLVRRAPATRPGHHLPADHEPALYAHYDLDYHVPARAGTRLSLLP